MAAPDDSDFPGRGKAFPRSHGRTGFDPTSSPPWVLEAGRSERGADRLRRHPGPVRSGTAASSRTKPHLLNSPASWCRPLATTRRPRPAGLGVERLVQITDQRTGRAPPRISARLGAAGSPSRPSALVSVILVMVGLVEFKSADLRPVQQLRGVAHRLAGGATTPTIGNSLEELHLLGKTMDEIWPNRSRTTSSSGIVPEGPGGGPPAGRKRPPRRNPVSG